MNDLETYPHLGHIEEAIVIIPSRTYAAHCHALLRVAMVMLVFQERLSFEPATEDVHDAGSDPVGRLLFYMGGREELFVNTFSSYGPVLKPLKVA